MMFTLDLSGYADNGAAGIDRFGGLFMTAEKAEAHGKIAAKCHRRAFRPSTLWVRDQEGKVIRQIAI